MSPKKAQMILFSALGVVATTFVAAAEVRPFKVGTFDAQGRVFVGAVVDDSVVIDLGAAASGLKKSASAAPRDMRDLIARYDSGMRDLIVAAVAGATARGATPSYALDLHKVRTLAPVMPQTMMNAAVNYTDHASEMGRGSAASAPPPGAQSVPGLWERKPDDTRWNPYLFLKAPAAIIASGEAIRLPPARDQIDYECEMAVVIGKAADHVPVTEARAHIFGYTVHLDVSDRSGQRNERFGSDWLVGKSHATFAPLGPYIVPKEFIADPQKLKIQYTLNGKLMQDADTSLMVHSIDELVSYGSNILPLQPGDVINTGTPAGVGAGRKPPVFLKAGDRSSCTYASIGTLVNTVVNSK
jgi:2-keto-4-pentenoate hydratase/2-oxohepta-3-ene-1,7-dioic acid hydratase in catechol pathway